MKALKLVAVLVGIVFVVIFPFLSTKTYFVHIAALTGIFIILALSYDLVVGQIGVFSLGHPAFFGIGGYTAAILGTRYDLPFLLNILIGAVLAGLFAILIGVPAFRLSSRYSFAMATLGLGLVMETVATNWDSLTNGPLCISRIPSFRLGVPGLFTWEASGTMADYYVIFAFVFLCWLAIRRIVRSRIGRAFVSIRDDEILAASRGIAPLRYKMLAFIVSALFAGIAGVLFVHFINVACTTLFGIDVTITLLVIEFLGGTGNLVGVAVGAVLFTALPEYLRLAAAARPLIYGVTLLFILIYTPNGLAGLFASAEQLIEGRFLQDESVEDIEGTQSASGVASERER